MPNPVPARYTVQLGPTVTPETAGELAAWARQTGRSTSEMARLLLEEGLRRQRAKLEREHGSLSAGLLAECVAAAQERAERQVSRRRSYDKRTRNGETGMSGTLAARRAEDAAA